MTREPFEWVVSEYGPMVLRVCRAVLGPSDAEDAWSETFLAALRAYPALPSDAKVAAWLVTIAHHKAVDALRARGRRPVPAGAVPRLSQAAAPGPEPGPWHGGLWTALRALPSRQRHAVVYHYLAGLPYRDVAAITGGSVEAARRAAADGIRALRARASAETKDGESW